MRPLPVVQRFVLTFVALLSTPGALAAGITLEAPAQVPMDGTPFEVHVSLEGLEGPVELKLGLGPEGRQASRTWDGSAWTRSDRYVLAVAPDPTGVWSGAVALRANPDSANHPRLFTEPAWVQARTRGAASLDARAPVGPLAQGERGAIHLAPGATLSFTTADTWYRYTAVEAELLDPLIPADATVCLDDRCTPLALDVVAAGAAGAAIASQEVTPAELEGATLVLPAGACPLDGPFAPGATRLVALESWPQRGRPEPVPCEPIKTNAPVGLYDLGRLVVPLPERRGWTLRTGPDTWSPWSHPDGTVPLPVRSVHTVGHARAFGTQEAGLSEVLGLLSAAQQRITVASYLLTHSGVASALADAAVRGVDVTLLLEPSPVGGRPPQTGPLLDALVAAGVTVRFDEGPGVQHAKVVVVDGAVVLVLTENLTHSGLPEDGDGNLGAGLGIANATLAREVEARLVGERGPARVFVPDGWRAFAGEVVVLSSPENAWRPEGVPAWIEASSGGIDGAVLRASPDWQGQPNPWLEALVNASAAGRSVRLLLNGAGPGGYDEDTSLALAHLASHPRAGSLHAVRSPPDGPVVHAKMLAGEDWVLVGSSNFVASAALTNREIGFLVRDAGLADELRGVLASREEDRGVGGGAVRGAPAPGFGVLPVLVVVLVAYGRTQMRSPKTGSMTQRAAEPESAMARSSARAADRTR